MWLPKDEARLLAGYFRNIEKPGEEEVYQLAELIRLLKRGKETIRSYLEGRGGESCAPASEIDIDELKKKMSRYISESARVEHANMLLDRRALIKLTPHQHASGVFVIELTLEGYDLGRRYANWFWASGLWFQEVRNHWIWLIVSFLGGVLGALLIDWLGQPSASSR